MKAHDWHHIHSTHLYGTALAWESTWECRDCSVQCIVRTAKSSTIDPSKISPIAETMRQQDILLDCDQQAIRSVHEA